VATKKNSKPKSTGGTEDDTAPENLEKSIDKAVDASTDASAAEVNANAADNVSDVSDMSAESDDRPVHDEDDHEADAGDMPEPGDDVELVDEDAPSDDIDDASDKPHADDLPPEIAPVVEEKVVERIIERRRSFFPALIGGIAAAAIGFIAGRGGYLDQYVDQYLPRPANPVETQVTTLQSDVTALRDTVAALGDQVTETGARVSDLQSTRSDLDALSQDVAAIEVPDLSGVESSVSDIGQSLTELNSGLENTTSLLADVNDRLTTIEKRPLDTDLSEQAIAAYERELADLQSVIARQRETLEGQIAEQQDGMAAQREAFEAQVAAQKEEVARLLDEAKALEASANAAEKAAAVQTHVAAIVAAIDTGEPFAEAVGALEKLGVDVMDELSSTGETGVATLAALQGDFVPLARSALASSREASGSSQGLGSFLQRQLGARSVTPQEGDGPNAVLSRVEAAVSAGDLQTALEEAGALPDAAKSDLADWMSAAETRQAAANAASALIEATSSQ
jgi:hypothetical protein